MSKLRRYKNSGNLCFITSVTHNRVKLLHKNYEILSRAIDSTKNRIRFDLIGWVVLPDHFHFLIDTNGSDVSNIIQRIKMSFGALYRDEHSLGSGRIWQSRFWDHVIRNQKDYNHHLDYIHYNPVKHGYVRSPFDWEYSSLHSFYQGGFYEKDWGLKDDSDFNAEYGE
jgi:putative transposase